MKTESLNKRPIKLLPWIEDGSYLTDEYDKKIEATMVIIRGTAEQGTPRWYLNNKTVI